MSEIKLLDINTINKIAAGEVVERPSSVVKELVENSIDAGAKHITVEIEDGGTALIKITDDGSGIPKEQVKTAFVRHATSKIQTVNDINSVMTLGFRGEALPSIASVSQMELVTRTADDTTATKIEVFGGNIVGFYETSAPVGTSISVRSLFYNVPARKKFLKKNSIEAGQITELVNKMALGNINVSFKHTNNGTLMLHTTGKNILEDAIFNVYGKETAKRLIKIDFTDSELKIYGFVGKPDAAKANRSSGNIFINGRLIKSDIVQSAIEEAYKTRITVGKFPLYVLNIKLQAENVDVNVHPAKLEVRFHNEDLVFNNVFGAISDALQADVLIPDVKWGSGNSKKTEEEEKPQEEHSVQPLIKIEDLTEQEPKPPAKYPTHIGRTSESKPKYTPIDFSIKDTAKETEKVTAAAKPDNVLNEAAVKAYIKPAAEEAIISLTSHLQQKYTIVGQVFNTYWIVSKGESLYMIDQHAAHERILYEDALLKLKNTCVSQHLLQPLVIKLTPIEFQVSIDKREYLENLGFEYDEFGNNNIAIRALPVIFKDPVDAQFFLEIINMLINREDMTAGVSEKIASIACKAAIKGNRAISQTEAKGLIEKLLKMENPFSCPHGRPTIIEMKKSELEKNFKRIL